MIKAKSLKLITRLGMSGCSWEGVSDKGEEIVIRYKHGSLSVKINNKVISKGIYNGDGVPRIISKEDMMEWLKNFVDFKGCKFT